MKCYNISNYQTWHGRWAPNAEHSASKSSLRSVCATALTSPSLNTWSDLIAQTFQHASWMFHGCFPTNLLWHLPLHIFKSIPSAACASSSRLMLPEPSLSKTLWHSWHEATRDVMSNTAYTERFRWPLALVHSLQPEGGPTHVLRNVFFPVSWIGGFKFVEWNLRSGSLSSLWTGMKKIGTLLDPRFNFQRFCETVDFLTLPGSTSWLVSLPKFKTKRFRKTVIFKLRVTSRRRKAVKRFFFRGGEVHFAFQIMPPLKSSKINLISLSERGTLEKYPGCPPKKSQSIPKPLIDLSRVAAKNSV